MVCQGKANKAIASRLQLSEGTIKSHLRNIYRKLRVQTRAEAAAQAARLQL
jgi:LuxR family maltose regulon positive regulatory protein